MLNLKIGEIVKKLYLEEDNFGGGIFEGGASNYHDQFGHIIAAAFLSNWAREYSFISSPVVFSTQTLAAEQIAELFQRMIIRCEKGNIREHKILYNGTLEQTKITRILDHISFQFEENQCKVNFPSPNGIKLSKNEALSWTILFALEDLHVFAKYAVGHFDASLTNRSKLLKRWFDDSILFNNFKEIVARLMYYMAVNPNTLHSTKVYRKYLMDNCISIMGLKKYNHQLKPIIGEYLSDEELSLFYDTFIEYVNDLDKRGISLFGKPFSCMTIEQLDSLKIDSFLPSKDIPFKLSFEGQFPYSSNFIPKKRDYWLGIARYEKLRDIYLIENILPPSFLIN